MNHCIYVYRLAMPKTGSAIAAAITPAAIQPILYRITGTVMSTHRFIVNAMVMAVMTGMIATTGEMVTAVMTEMMVAKAAAMVMAKTKVVTAKEEISSA